MRVAVRPGSKIFTRKLVFSVSSAQLRASASIAALLAA
jgi:hypothetical protein